MSQLSIFDAKPTIENESDLLDYLRSEGYKKTGVGAMGSFWMEKEFTERDNNIKKTVIFRSDHKLVYMEDLRTKDHEHIDTFCKTVEKNKETINWIYGKLRS